MFKYAFFDLDGTLTQSASGILASYRYALDKFGIKLTSKEEELRLIGPPLYNSFTDYYGFDEDKTMEAIKYYREYYTAGGMYDAPPYDGITDMLSELQLRGVRLVVVTSKPQIYADDVVEHVGLNKYFNRVVGPHGESRVTNKAFLIRRAALEENIDNIDEVVMVGDRKYDIMAANEVGISSIGVTYGYGSYDELSKAQATYIADSPLDILKYFI